MLSLLGLLSSLLWGTSDYLGGVLTRRLPVLAVVGTAQVFGLIVMAIFATASGQWSSPLTYVPWALLAAVCGISGLIVFYLALARGTMGIVAPIAACGVVVPVGVGLFTGSVPAPVQAVGIVIAIIGLICATGPELQGGGDMKSLWLAAAAGVLFGITLTAIAVGSETSAVMTVTGMRVASVIFFVLLALIKHSTGGVRPSDFPALIVIGFCDASANVTLGLASTGDNLTVAAVLGSLYPVVTVLLAWRFLHERLRPIQYAGVAVTLVGVIAISAGASL